jgi:membrane protease YdiL (CAAX protease family)
VAIVLAFAISSILFSLAHHVGPMGEPLRLGVFVFRVMAGLFFGALYKFRSFPIAVYTHALYDIYVLIIG